MAVMLLCYAVAATHTVHPGMHEIIFTLKACKYIRISNGKSMFSHIAMVTEQVSPLMLKAKEYFLATFKILPSRQFVILPSRQFVISCMPPSLLYLGHFVKYQKAQVCLATSLICISRQCPNSARYKTYVLSKATS